MTNWSAKVEYLYTDLGSFDCAACSVSGSDSVDFKANLVRAGINYRF
jgi:outer membrane immunogenic protein